MFLGIPFDKIAHFIMFLPFVILGYAAFMPKEKGVMRKLVVLGTMLILGFAFAVSTERLQAITDYRSYEILDMAADCLGLVIGSLLTLGFIVKTDK